MARALYELHLIGASGLLADADEVTRIGDVVEPSYIGIVIHVRRDVVIGDRWTFGKYWVVDWSQLGGYGFRFLSGGIFPLSRGYISGWDCFLGRRRLTAFTGLLLFGGRDLTSDLETKTLLLNR